MWFAICYVGGITVALFIGAILLAWLWGQFSGKEITEGKLYVIWFVFSVLFLTFIFLTYNIGIQHGKDFMVTNYQVLGI